jgi:hypothetical protein
MGGRALSVTLYQPSASAGIGGGAIHPSKTANAWARLRRGGKSLFFAVGLLQLQQELTSPLF